MPARLRALLALASLALVAACSQTPAKTGGTAAAGSGDCAVSDVKRDPLPNGLAGGFSDPNRPPPWMGDQDFVAVLFYAAGGDPTISPGGKAPDGSATKILWLVRGATGPLTIRGTAPGGAGFTQNIDGGGSYPSIVDIPRSGCWTIEATVAGKRVGSIVLPAK
jgi:hypothetical protein